MSVIKFQRGTYETTDVASEGYERVDTWMGKNGELAFMKYEDGSCDLERVMKVSVTGDGLFVNDMLVEGSTLVAKKDAGYWESELEDFKRRIENLERAQGKNEVKTQEEENRALGYNLVERMDRLNSERFDPFRESSRGQRRKLNVYEDSGAKILSMEQIDALLAAARKSGEELYAGNSRG